jgi:UDPglucose--hexose-1-phosphate uridylyltransferase
MGGRNATTSRSSNAMPERTNLYGPMLYRTDHRKPDGRRLWLYSNAPVAAVPADRIPVPDPQPVAVSTHLRWHPLLGEWVIFAAHRQDRTFLPPADSNPLAPTWEPRHPTELPAGEYDVAVFENRFPSLAKEPGPAPVVAGVETVPAAGRSEVVVFAQNPRTSLGNLPVPHVALILAVWADRTHEMTNDGIAYVLPFENRGVEMGVTLHHPHAQIYGYAFVPSHQASTAERLAQYQREHGSDLVVDLARREQTLGVRVVSSRERALAFVPPFARFPYEIWITPLRPVPDLAGLTDDERTDMASVLAEALRRLDALWQRPMPYLLTVNQVPRDRDSYLGWTMRIEIWPIRRSPDKLKFLAGTELGAGVFASDVMPEDAAAQLRAVAL